MAFFKIKCKIKGVKFKHTCKIEEVNKIFFGYIQKNLFPDKFPYKWLKHRNGFSLISGLISIPMKSRHKAIIIT